MQLQAKVRQDNLVQPSDLSTLSTAEFSSETIRDWLVTYLANLLEVSSDDIDTEVPFDTYGLDSSAAIGLTGDLEDWIGKEVDPILLYDYPTVESLVSYLS